MGNDAVLYPFAGCRFGDVAAFAACGLDWEALVEKNGRGLVVAVLVELLEAVGVEVGSLDELAVELEED